MLLLITSLYWTEVKVRSITVRAKPHHEDAGDVNTQTQRKRDAEVEAGEPVR